MATFTTSSQYLHYAHGPAADDGYAPAVAVCSQIKGPYSGRTRLVLTDEIVGELLSMARYYDPPYPDMPPGITRCARRIVKELG